MILFEQISWLYLYWSSTYIVIGLHLETLVGCVHGKLSVILRPITRLGASHHVFPNDTPDARRNYHCQDDLEDWISHFNISILDKYIYKEMDKKHHICWVFANLLISYVQGCHRVMTKSAELYLMPKFLFLKKNNFLT